MRGFFASLLIILMSGCYSTRGFIDSKYKTIYVEPPYKIFAFHKTFLYHIPSWLLSH